MKILRTFFLIITLNISLAYAEKISPSGYAVATAHPLATQAALDILKSGGNAFDAAIAASAVLGVVAPYHSGLGGGGFWLLHLEKDQKNIVIDGREVAPIRASADMFLDPHLQYIKNSSLDGPLSAAIPGEPAALIYISNHYGRLPLPVVLNEAINLAENGFKIDEQFHSFILLRLKILQRYKSSASVFLKNNKPYEVGEIFRQPDLAKTLNSIAKYKENGFYQGDIAQKMVNSVLKNGGVWQLSDLKDYRIKIRTPLLAHYHDMEIITVPPPSAGGVALITMLNILSGYSDSTLKNENKIRLMIEAMRLAFSQRNQIGDPDFMPNPVAELLSPKNAINLRNQIKNPSSGVKNENLMNSKKRNTTHLSILDQDGNRVSATMTVNYIFGSGFVADQTGVLLNDEMDDFSTKPGEKNLFGIVGAEKNKIAPKKRPVSSMAPSFFEMPNRIAIVGTPGGSRIPTMLLIAALNFFDYQGAISMVSAMRFHHQFIPNVVEFEPETFSPWLKSKLTTLGYHLLELRQFYGDMQVITWEMDKNFISAASDPRHIGLAFVVSQEKTGYGFSY